MLEFDPIHPNPAPPAGRGENRVLRRRPGWTAALAALLVASAACLPAARPPSTPPAPAPTKQARPEKPDQRTEKPEPRAESRPDLSAYTDHAEVPTASAAELRRRAESAADLRWLPAAPALAALLPGVPPTRAGVLDLKRRAAAAADPATLARANAVLAGEAFARSAPVVRRWLDRRDSTSGLIPTTRPAEGTAGWFYKDTSSDLLPHIAIGTALLLPDRYPDVLAVLAAERRLAPAADLPDDLLLPDWHRAGLSADDRLFGAAEYAKDGLLPLLERLGPDPWLGRIRELADAVLAAAATPTPRGPIPSRGNEVNGDMLQVLVRAYWATGDQRYFQAADRIARSYVEDMLPRTKWLPIHEWDFAESEPIGEPRLRLSDHGNEILAGLVTWHAAASLRGEADAPAHRAAIRRMLDRMLDHGRNPDGLWYRVLEVPSGKVDQEGLTDNWGYLVQAYLAQAALERSTPGGEPARADRYEEAARAALRALPRYAYYPWQRGEMDGYADTLEGALSLLPRLPDEAAARWLDEQVAVLYGFQSADGRVDDNYLDGNFVRTALLYGLQLTGGAWPEPWRPDLLIGAAPSGPCLDVAAISPAEWQGRLRFDTPRHRTHLRLPVDLPRINEWPEGFAVEGGRSYLVAEPGLPPVQLDGAALAAGLPLRLDPGLPRTLRVCPAA